MSPILAEIKPETAERLTALAKAKGKSVDEYLNSLLPPAYEHTEGQETIGQRLQRKGLIGIIDSSQSEDPDSPPRHTAFGQLVAEKLRKQGLKLPHDTH